MSYTPGMGYAMAPLFEAAWNIYNKTVQKLPLWARILTILVAMPLYIWLIMLFGR